MKERPILFSGAMVSAILEGRKTQTRRVLKPQPAWDAVGNPSIDFDSKVWRVFINEGKYAGWTTTPWWNCPYGQTGDRLWVRETFMIPDGNRHLATYRADEPNTSDLKWKPSIFMPRWASRITLEITGIRVERLHDISEADALAEGISDSAVASFTGIAGVTRPAAFAYRELWISINGSESWEANPWVWVVEFKTVEAGK